MEIIKAEHGHDTYTTYYTAHYSTGKYSRRAVTYDIDDNIIKAVDYFTGITTERRETYADNITGEEVMKNKLPDDIAGAIELKFEPNPDGSATAIYATSTYERAEVTYDSSCNIVNITRYITGPVGHQDHAVERNTTGEEDMNAQVNRGCVLLKAAKIINGERQDQYGNPEDNFKAIGELWTMYLKHRGKNRNSYEGVVTIGPKDVALMMVLFKIARELNGAGKEDNLIDAAGYIGLAADMSNYEQENNNN